MSRNVCAVLTDSEDVLNRVVLYFLILLSHNWFSLVVVIQKNVSRFIDFFWLNFPLFTRTCKNVILRK